MKKYCFVIGFIFIFTFIFYQSKDEKYEIVLKNGAYGIIDQKKYERISFDYKKIFSLRKLYILLKGNKVIVLDDKLNKKIEYSGDDIYYLNEYNFLLKRNNKYFVWSRNKLFPVDHSVEQVFDKYIVKRENQKAIMKNIETNQILITGYDGIYFQDLENIIVEQGGKYGVIDLKNNKKIELKYDNISPLINNKYYIVEQNFRSGILDKNGKVIVPLEYISIENIVEKYVIVYSEKGAGIINLSNEVIVPCKYDKIEIKENQILVYLQNKLEKKYNIKN